MHSHSIKGSLDKLWGQSQITMSKGKGITSGKLYIYRGHVRSMKADKLQKRWEEGETSIAICRGHHTHNTELGWGAMEKKTFS